MSYINAGTGTGEQEPTLVIKWSEYHKLKSKLAAANEQVAELEARALPLVREIPGSEEIKVGDLVTYADSYGVLRMREIQGPVIGHYAGGVSYCVYRPIQKNKESDNA